jgi:hypothetical protein
MEVIRSSETLVYIRTKRRYIPEDGRIHNYRCENLKSYTVFKLLPFCTQNLRPIFLGIELFLLHVGRNQQRHYLWWLSNPQHEGSLFIHATTNSYQIGYTAKTAGVHSACVTWIT